MVMNGPVAMAGSMLNFSNVMGTMVPKMEANITTAKSDSETETVMSELPMRIQL